VTVQNVDEAVKKAEGLGAKVFAPPFDVMDAGRMAVLQDPTGAVFQVWQANKHIGAKILNEPGALCWTELTTTDTKAAEQFYTQLFGWSPKHSAPGAPMEYTEFSVAGTPSIGMMAKPADMPAHIPSYWMPYFQVTSVDASASKAKELGGKAMVGPQDIPGTGRFAILADPQGAMFAVFQR
jgi:predicted enzyme related to lactoylglutathione lyase